MQTRKHAVPARCRRRRRWLAPASVALLAPLIVGACYPGSVTDPERDDVILTVFDTAADFSAVGSYFMPDTIIREFEGDVPSAPADALREFEEAILAEVENQFSALGYRRIEDPAEGAPDAIVLVSVNTNEQIVWVPGCWYCAWSSVPWGPDWGLSWGPGYTPDYPFDGPGLGVRAAGTLLVALVDPVAPGTDIPVWWAGVANGLLSRDSNVDLPRVQQAIGQMFVQSPYLGEGGEG